MKTIRNLLTIVVIALLLYFPVFAVCFRMGGSVVGDPDVWWHLRTADWIAEHGTVPRFDTFAAPGPLPPAKAGDDGNGPKPSAPVAKGPPVSADEDTPWVDYSWAAELVLGGLHRVLGLKGLVVYSALWTLGIVLAIYSLIRRMQQNLLVSAVLTLAATEGIMGLATPRPWLFSMLFFAIEIYLLLEAGRTARPRLLLWLVPMFWVWSNVHIQFTLGLVVLAAAVVEPLLAPRLPLVLDDESTAISPRWLLTVFLLCCGATLLNPYHVQVYVTAVQLLGQSELWEYIVELAAMPFRTIADWAVLAAALAGAAAIASRRPVRLLLVLLFPLAVYISFRSRRDVWFVLVVGLALAASASRGLPLAPTRLTARGRWGVAVLLTALVAGSLLTQSESNLKAQMEKQLPVKAVAFLQKNSYQGPMYNTYNWGGYLIYSYPQERVSLDGRTLIYGSARIVHNIKMAHGEESWQSDPALDAARFFILPRKDAITLLMRLDSRFKVEYEDDLAVVFVRK